MPAAVVDEFRVGMIAGGFKSGDISFRLLIREALADQFENLFFGLTDILQPADLRAGKSRQALFAALDDNLNRGIRKADELQHHRIAAEGIEFVCLSHLQDLHVGVARAGQGNDGISAGEFVIVVARRLEQGEAQRVAGSGLFELREFANFHGRNIHLLDLHKIGGPHPRLIQSRVVNLRLRFAPRKSESQQREK